MRVIKVRALEDLLTDTRSLCLCTYVHFKGSFSSNTAYLRQQNAICILSGTGNPQGLHTAVHIMLYNVNQCDI